MLRLCLTLGTAALFATGAHAAAFQNGSFEAGSFVDTPPTDNIDQLFAGSTAITGWTVIGGSDIAWERNGTASSGLFSLDLTGYTDQAPYGGVRQTFDTVAGHHYALSYDVGNIASNNAAVSASINGVTIFTFVNPTAGGGTTPTYRTGTTSFFANGAATQLDLLGVAGGDAIFLDNVSVVDLDASGVPEPISWSMMIVGFGLVGSGMRLRQREMLGVA